MFVVLLTYTKPLGEIDRLMAEHVAFLGQGYRTGVFLVSGRRIPRSGGVILASAPGRAELEDLMARDPFIREGAASYEIIEFKSSLHHPALAAFADPGTRAVRGTPAEGS
jgi:uncharacterized protein YciI